LLSPGELIPAYFFVLFWVNCFPELWLPNTENFVFFVSFVVNFKIFISYLFLRLT